MRSHDKLMTSLFLQQLRFIIFNTNESQTSELKMFQDMLKTQISFYSNVSKIAVSMIVIL